MAGGGGRIGGRGRENGKESATVEPMLVMSHRRASTLSTRAAAPTARCRADDCCHAVIAVADDTRTMEVASSTRRRYAHVMFEAIRGELRVMFECGVEKDERAGAAAPRVARVLAGIGVR